MSIRAIVGAQWGDEGKGKIVDLLAGQYDIVARFQGGANAGHTVVINGDQHILHLIPSGIFNPQAKCYIGNGLVLDPQQLIAEITALKREGIDPKNRLFISGNAHVIFPYHKIIDSKENNSGQNKNVKIGTTGRGIGPAYADKADRRGIRIIDLLDKNKLRQKIRINLLSKAHLLYQELIDQKINLQDLTDEFYTHGQYLKKHSLIPYDISNMINGDIKSGKNILLEGAQGVLLDRDFGTYPFVTSSNPSDACTGLGFGPTHITSVMGIAKAYFTRVGEGPFPTEFDKELSEIIRQKGGEFGATTGRPRRCGWFDAVLNRYTARVAGFTEVALTKLDVLSGLKAIKICEAYTLNGRPVNKFIADVDQMKKIKPVYTELPGWQQDISGVRNFGSLPKEAQNYVRRIEELVEVPVSIISVGAEREQTIFM